jgi:hypothetical protein
MTETQIYSAVLKRMGVLSGVVDDNEWWGSSCPTLLPLSECRCSHPLTHCAQCAVLSI